MTNLTKLQRLENEMQEGVEVFVYDTSKGTRETRFIKPRSLEKAKEMKDKMTNAQNVPSVYGVLKTWKEITNHYRDMETTTLSLMRNADSTAEQLTEAHKLYLSATVGMRDMRNRLNSIYNGKFHFTTHGYERA
jgi:hypothetical protein